MPPVYDASCYNLFSVHESRLLLSQSTSPNMSFALQRGGATNGTAGAAGATDANRAGPAEKRARVGDKPPAAADANSNSSGSTAQSETLPGISIAPKVSESAAAAAAKNGVGHMNWMIRYGDNGETHI
jgi:hypothetical protein